MADSTTNRPLWQVMQDAGDLSDSPDGEPWGEHHVYAAELRAIADWLVPEETEPPLGVVPKSQINQRIDEHSEWREWFVRDSIRNELLAEAGRAEAGAEE